MAHFLLRLELVAVHSLEALVSNGVDLEEEVWVDPTSLGEDYLAGDLEDLMAE